MRTSYTPPISFQIYFLRARISPFVKDYPAVIQTFSTYPLFYACVYTNYRFYTRVYGEYINRLFKTLLINMTKHVRTINNNSHTMKYNYGYIICLHSQNVKNNYYSHIHYISISRLYSFG